MTNKLHDTRDNPQWRFRKMRPGEINVDPIEGEFFTTEAVGSINDALVRESIQNSLDAAQGVGPVTVRFSFYSESEKDPAVDNYLNGLFSHLKTRHSGLQELPGDAETFEYILIEDYGTRGLQGDVRQYDDLDDDIKKNDFYYFWRNIGRTRKETTDIGRWGLGKTVFQAASRMNAFFGFTIRRDDGQALLMGQSVLKIHRLDGSRFAPYGYFGLFEDDLALPVNDTSYLETFSNRFHLERFEKPGLSVLIPYPDREITPRDCLRSCIRHYFFPILSGKLIIELNADGTRYVLDAEMLDEVLKKTRWKEKQGMLGLIDFARWAIGQPESAFIRLKEPTVGRAPKLRDLFDENLIDALHSRFADGDRLAFFVPVHVIHKKNSAIKTTGFSVYLERDEKLETAEDHFIRQGITIPEVTALKHKGIRAIVSIAEPDLSSFLGDAENPAHTEWERNSKKFKQKYKLGPSTLDFIKTSPREIVKALTQPKKGRDENLLRHIFSLPTQPEEISGAFEKDAAGTGDPKTRADERVEIVNSNSLKLSPIKGGFRLSRRSNSIEVPRYISVWTAYEVRSGNPFKKYSPLDFELAKPPIQMELEGGKLLLCKDNIIQFEVLQGDFKLSVTGFDMHRDLRVKTIP